MFDEDELLPLSGLQHLEFCERQWALIHIERLWAENALTADGRVLHERVHDAADESRVDVLVCRGVDLWSVRLGVYGQADVVEFRRAPAGEMNAAELPGREGRWRPFPVEYKRGKPKAGRCDEVQLCAQAMCLEERFGVELAEGALFYGTPRRRTGVLLDRPLRERTEALSRRMHELYAGRQTPAPVYGPRCEKCSLREVCLPQVAGKRGAVSRYLARASSEE